jgi:hypothetical protein
MKYISALPWPGTGLPSIRHAKSCSCWRVLDTTGNFFSFIGYNMDPERFERTVAHGIADAVAMEEKADAALLVPA